jgi:branched-chain amino acid transport system permease protein
MGINTAYYKTATFGLSAAYTGIGGALSGFAVGHIAPDSFTFFLSISFIIGVTIGGNASIIGPFIGALFIQFVPNFADEISKAAPWAIYGLTLIAVVYLMPDGIVGALDRRLKAVVVWWSRRRRPQAPLAVSEPGKP